QSRLGCTVGLPERPRSVAMGSLLQGTPANLFPMQFPVWSIGRWLSPDRAHNLSRRRNSGALPLRRRLRVVSRPSLLAFHCTFTIPSRGGRTWGRRAEL